MDEIKRQARERGYNSYHFSFSGGEPTLHPGLLDVLQHYNDDLPSVNFQSTHLTTNMSPGMRWWEKYVQATQNLHRVSITASWHREQGIKENNLPKFMKKFADKLVFLQECDVEVTINMVMVPEQFDEFYREAEYFQSRGINVTLKPQSDPTASKVVDTYTSKQLKIIQDGMPQRDFTGARTKVSRPKPRIPLKEMSIQNGDTNDVPMTMQVELEDSTGEKWYMDQAERFNAFNFNKFKGWACEAGFRSIVIREPDGLIKRSYSCWDKPLGHIETGFKLFDQPAPCITDTCVSSADSKIPKRKME
jgi:organic radical activating enzyme